MNDNLISDRRDEIPLDVLRSSAVESLLSQNEDLTARLRVTLQRLVSTEAENYQQRSQIESLQKQAQALQDQILVNREKQVLEKAREDSVEKQVLSLKRQLDITQMEYAEMRIAGQKIKFSLFLLQKYRERIQKWVGPAFKKSRIQLSQVREALSQRESMVQSLREQILEVSKTALRQVAEAQKQHLELVEYNEGERKTWVSQNELLKNINLNLESKIEKLELESEKHDAIQNKNIALERTQDETQKRLTSEIQILQKSEAHLKLELQSLASQVHSLTAQNQELKNASLQLESTRYLWKEKCEELEKLQAAYSALEKLIKK
ncbi:MAG: hypothetical protein AB7H97_11355 [Pseudobdellovibrionaceae bacterium]